MEQVKEVWVSLPAQEKNYHANYIKWATDPKYGAVECVKYVHVGLRRSPLRAWMNQATGPTKLFMYRECPIYKVEFNMTNMCIPSPDRVATKELHAVQLYEMLAPLESLYPDNKGTHLVLKGMRIRGTSDDVEQLNTMLYDVAHFESEINLTDIFAAGDTPLQLLSGVRAYKTVRLENCPWMDGDYLVALASAKSFPNKVWLSRFTAPQIEQFFLPQVMQNTTMVAVKVENITGNADDFANIANVCVSYLEHLKKCKDTKLRILSVDLGPSLDDIVKEKIKDAAENLVAGPEGAVETNTKMHCLAFRPVVLTEKTKYHIKINRFGRKLLHGMEHNEAGNEEAWRNALIRHFADNNFTAWLFEKNPYCFFNALVDQVPDKQRSIDSVSNKRQKLASGF